MILLWGRGALVWIFTSCYFLRLVTFYDDWKNILLRLHEIWEVYNIKDKSLLLWLDS